MPKICECAKKSLHHGCCWPEVSHLPAFCPVITCLVGLRCNGPSPVRSRGPGGFKFYSPDFLLPGFVLTCLPLPFLFRLVVFLLGLVSSQAHARGRWGGEGAQMCVCRDVSVNVSISSGICAPLACPPCSISFPPGLQLDLLIRLKLSGVSWRAQCSFPYPLWEVSSSGGAHWLCWAVAALLQ